MGRKLNLSHLSEQECEQILKVIQRDFDLRQQEKGRLAKIQEEIQDDIKTAELLGNQRQFNEKYCLRCFDKFTFLINPRVQCAGCHYSVCRKCAPYHDLLKQHACRVCLKQSGLMKQSNAWFYTNVRDRFKRFGSAKVVRSLHDRRQSLSDAESDLGYQPSFRSLNLEATGDAELSPKTDDSNKDEPSELVKSKKKLDLIVRTIRRTCFSNGSDSSSTTSDKQPHSSAMNQQVHAVRSLLMTMAVNIAGDLNEHCDQPEQSNEVLLHVLRERVRQLCAMVFNDNQQATQQLFSANVSTVDEFIKETSEAFVAKVYADAKEADDNAFHEGPTNGIDSVDFPHQSNTNGIESNDDANFNTTGCDAFNFMSTVLRSAKPSLLPDLSQPSSDIDSDLDIVSNRSTHRGGSKAGNTDSPWILEPKVAAVIKQKIPYSHHNGYKKQSASDDEQPAIPLFLPRNDTSDGPMIGDREASQLSDDSDTVHDDDEDDEQRRLSVKTDSSVQTENSPPRSTFHGPWFVRPPADVTVSRGEMLHCDCVIGGTLPVDVFWYHDVRQLDDDGGIHCTVSQNSSGVSSVTLSNVTAEDAGSYVCIAVNKHATCRHSFQVTVTDDTAEKRKSGTITAKVHLRPHGNINGMSPSSGGRWPESGEFLGADRTSHGSGASSVKSEGDLNGNGEAIQDRPLVRQESFGAKRMKKLADSFKADLGNIQKGESQKTGSIPPTNSQAQTKEDKQSFRATNKNEVFPVRLSLCEATPVASSENFVDVAVHKDELQDSYDEFEKVFEANMRSRTPVTPTSLHESLSSRDGSQEIGDHGLVDCGPRRVDVTKYRRDYIVPGERTDSRSVAPKRNISTRSMGSSVYSDDARSDRQCTDDEDAESNKEYISPQRELEMLPLPSVRGLKEMFTAMDSASLEESNFRRVSSLTARCPPISVAARRKIILSQMSEDLSAEPTDWLVSQQLPIIDQKYTGESLVREKRNQLIPHSPPISPPTSTSSHSLSIAKSPTVSTSTSPKN